MATTLKDYLIERMKTLSANYIEDLEACSEEVLASNPGGSARTAYDFTYEVIVVNRRITKRLKGEDPGPFPRDGWIKAPPEFCAKSVAIADFRASAEDVMAAFEADPESEIERKIALPAGETSPLDLITLTYNHWNYHDAQLNYLQAIRGDEAVHWKSE